MKKLSLFCAIGAVLLSGQAHADPKISGTIKAIVQQDIKHEVRHDLTRNEITKDEKSGRAILNGASRLKFSGSNKINDILTVSYSFEYDIALDYDRKDRKDRKEKNFDSRSTYASLDHKKYGRIRVGRMTNPEDDLDIGVTVGDNLGTLSPFASFGGRSNNAIQYYSPYFGKDKGTRIKLHYGMDENNDIIMEDDTESIFNTYVGGTEFTEKKRDHIVAQIMHNNKTYGWGLAYTQAGKDYKSLAGMLRYQPNPKLTLGLLVRQADQNSPYKELGGYISASYTMDNKWRVYGQTGYSTNLNGVKDTKLNNGAIGLSKEIKTSSGRATIFGELAGDWYDRTRISSRGNTIKTTQDTLGFGAGLIYKF